MTRMWMLPSEYLCQNHLMGEHAELHQLVGTIKRHPHGDAIAEGHAKKGNIDTTLIGRRHSQLVAEMERRGMNHDSPIETVSVAIGSVDRQHNLRDLTERCDDCRGRVIARLKPVENEVWDKDGKFTED